MIGIYAIRNKINNKYYIGESLDIDTRWSRHKSHMKKGYHRNKKLKNDLLEYGYSIFEFIIIKDLDYLNKIGSKDIIENILLIIESLYMEKYDSLKNGYNKSDSFKAKIKIHPETKEELMKLYENVYKNNEEYDYKIN